MKIDAHGRTSQKASQMIGDRYEMVHIAACRARELQRGAAKKVDGDNGHCVTAIREIEEGHVGREYLDRITHR
jgi:DNA-directed RNA polymerase omega subunit